MLTTIAQQRHLANVELMVNMPSVGEAYHASWRAHSRGEAHEIWRIEMPLIVDSTRVGHIKLAGIAAGEFSEWFTMLGKSLQPFENDLGLFVQQIRRKSPSTTASPVLVQPMVSEQLVT
jgi:hypothetical protein